MLKNVAICRVLGGKEKGRFCWLDCFSLLISILEYA